MKNKIFSAIISAAMLVCSVGSYSVNALQEVPDEYYGYHEEISIHGYIIKVKDIDSDVTPDSLGIDKSNIYCKVYPVKLTDEEEIGYDGRLAADYSDEKFGGYSVCEEKTGYYYIYSGGRNYEFYAQKPYVEEVYSVFNVLRNGLDANQIDATVLGGGHNKIFTKDELLENDANNDGKITAEDALKVLNAVVHKETFTIEEKIQLGISNSFNYVDSEKYQNLTSEKALEILRQVAES